LCANKKFLVYRWKVYCLPVESFLCTSGKFPCAVGHTFRSRSPAGAPGLATVLQTTPVWEEQRGRPERRRAKSFTCRAGKGKKKRDRALPSESARRITTSAAHEFAKRVNLPNVFAKLLEMYFCPFCQFFKDAKCFWPTVGDALMQGLQNQN
jgi:hypothetical protein